MNRVKFAAANSKRSKIASELRDLSRKLRDAGDKKDEYKKQIDELNKDRKAIENDGILWRSPCTAEAALIIADELVFAGGQGKVTAFNAANGQEVWNVNVEGAARGLAIANDSLFVSTTVPSAIGYSNYFAKSNRLLDSLLLTGRTV